MHRYVRINHLLELDCRLNLRFCWFLHSLSILLSFVLFQGEVCQSKGLSYHLMLHQSYPLGSYQNAFLQSLYVQYLKLTKQGLLIHLKPLVLISPFVKVIHAYFLRPHLKPLGKLRQIPIPLNLFQINHR